MPVINGRCFSFKPDYTDTEVCDAATCTPGPWHIIQRGNNRSACFYADDDYHRYLETLQQQAVAHGCSIHAYCLMTNHVHLLLTPERSDSAGLMMHLGQR